MRKMMLPIAAALATLCSSAGVGAVPVEVSQKELSPGVYQFTVAADGYVEQLNTVAVVTGTDVLVFDTTTRPSTARTILDRIRKVTSKPIRYVVNSHWHPDHWSGNEVFVAAAPGVDIIATEQMRDFMLNTTAFWGTYLPNSLAAQEKMVAANHAKNVGPDGSPLTAELRKQINNELQMIRDLVAEQAKVKRTYPTLTYDKRMVLRHGGREFVFLSVTGDAAGTTVMYLPKERILVTGDAVSAPLPYYTPPLSAHAASLRDLMKLDVAIIVPGHGPTMTDKRYMELEAELFEDVLRQTEAALRAGAVTIDDAQAKTDFSKFRDRFANGNPDNVRYFDSFTKGLVRKAYIELRDSKEIR